MIMKILVEYYDTLCIQVAPHMVLLNQQPHLLLLLVLGRNGLPEQLLLVGVLRAAEPAGGRRLRRARQGQERLRLVRLVRHLQPLQEGRR